MKSFTPGQLVITSVRTGEYVAEVMEVSANKVLTKTLAVRKHPTQGDLHNRNQVDVVLFHQRRALSYLEKVWLPAGHVTEYPEVSAPDYQESLRAALDAQIAELTQQLPSPFAARSLIELDGLKKEYFPKG